jgi:hypothetical protein
VFEANVSPSLLSRMNNGQRPDLDGFVALVQWLGSPAENFMVKEGEQAQERPQPAIEAELAPLLRARKDLDETERAYLLEIVGSNDAQDQIGSPGAVVTLRRGFKKEAKSLALKAREELKIEAFAPFDPYALAELYGIEAHDLSAPDLPAAAVQHFTTLRTEVFSASLVSVGTGCIVIENHVHDSFRRRSTMAHEMAHVLLEHEFGFLLASDNGCRASSSVIEEEAAELSGGDSSGRSEDGWHPRVSV